MSLTSLKALLKSTVFTLNKADGQALRTADLQKSAREFSHSLDLISVAAALSFLKRSTITAKLEPSFPAAVSLVLKFARKLSNDFSHIS